MANDRRLNLAKADANNLSPGTNENIAFKTRSVLESDFDIIKGDYTAKVNWPGDFIHSFTARLTLQKDTFARILSRLW